MWLIGILIMCTYRAKTELCDPHQVQINTRLRGHVIATSSLPAGHDFCLDMCSLNPNCHSVNSNTDQNICEHNKANHLSNPESLKNEGGWTYENFDRHPVMYCSNKLCGDNKDNKGCVMEEKKYKCVGMGKLSDNQLIIHPIDQPTRTKQLINP